MPRNLISLQDMMMAQLAEVCLLEIGTSIRFISFRSDACTPLLLNFYTSYLLNYKNFTTNKILPLCPALTGKKHYMIDAVIEENKPVLEATATKSLVRDCVLLFTTLKILHLHTGYYQNFFNVLSTLKNDRALDYAAKAIDDKLQQIDFLDRLGQEFLLPAIAKGLAL